jgi:DNA-binding NarL/FixJ family response regulator
MSPGLANARPVSPIRLVVADDHRIFRQGLCALLSRVPDVVVVGEAANGEEAILRVREKKPDVLLLDLDMPILDGVAVLRVLARRPDRPKVVLLSSYEDDGHVRSAMQAGASAYVAKRVDLHELVLILKGVVTGTVLTSPYLANLALGPAPGSRERIARLSPKEREVLVLLVEGSSNSEIAHKVYMSTDTVKAYLKSIFEKMKVRNRTQAAVVALQAGLSRPPSEEDPDPHRAPIG